MWLPDPPDVGSLPRQGDLMQGLPFPQKGSVSLHADGIRAEMKEQFVLVLDQCCTVEQQHTVLLARVHKNSVRVKPGDPFYEALTNVEADPSKPYAKYAHLLEVPPGFGGSRLWSVDLTNRFSFMAADAGELQWLQDARIARMEVRARAHLRMRLQFHFGEVAEEDVAELATLGLDKFGRPANDPGGKN